MGVGRTEATLRDLENYLVESVATPEGCGRIVAETEERLGEIDVLVNNAGIDSGEEQLIWKQSPELWEAVMATNLSGPFHLSRLVAGGMVARGWGRIVMVASTAGLAGGRSLSAYTTSKHGMIGLMRAIAQDVAGCGVTCNAVCPGWVRTEMGELTAARESHERGVPAEQIWEERAAASPGGRIVTVQEVADVIGLLASDALSGVNGEAIRVALGSLW